MDDFHDWGHALQLSIELIATAAFALSGVMEAARKRLDAVGVCVVGFLCAFGGGTLRDLLLDQRPFFWVKHVEVLWGVFALCLLAMLFLRPRHFRVTERAIQWPDALGLGLFTAAGVNQSLAMGLPAIVSVLMGVITAVFGGVLRDMVCNEIPTAFNDHRPYAVCAFAGAWIYIALWSIDSPAGGCMLISLICTVILRALALWFNWQLPPWRQN